MKTEGFTVWLTGLQGTGKRAISDELARMLVARHVPVEQLDIRTPGLDVFRSADPTQPAAYERRLGFLAGTLNRNGVAVIVATMSPSREVRDAVREDIPRFLEVYVKPRDQTAAAHYEEPLRPDVEVTTTKEEATAAAGRIVEVLERLGHVQSGGAEAATSPDEEQQIIKRLKDFGYM